MSKLVASISSFLGGPAMHMPFRYSDLTQSKQEVRVGEVTSGFCANAKARGQSSLHGTLGGVIRGEKQLVNKGS